MVFEKVKKIIVDELSIEPEKITMNTHLIDDLGADSLDAVELIMAIEDEFDVQFSDEETQNIKFVGDLVKFIEKQK